MMFEETPTLDGNFFGTYNEDEMPWPSLRCCATDLDADDKKGALIDGTDKPHSSANVADCQDMDDEGESDKDHPDNEEVVCEEEGTDVSEDPSRIMIENFPSQYGDVGVAIERGSGSLYKRYNNDCQEDLKENMYVPFKSKLNWDFT
jgi:hypothetical protein